MLFLHFVLDVGFSWDWCCWPRPFFLPGAANLLWTYFMAREIGFPSQELGTDFQMASFFSLYCALLLELLYSFQFFCFPIPRDLLFSPHQVVVFQMSSFQVLERLHFAYSLYSTNFFLCVIIFKILRNATILNFCFTESEK